MHDELHFVFFSKQLIDMLTLVFVLVLFFLFLSVAKEFWDTILLRGTIKHSFSSQVSGKWYILCVKTVWLLERKSSCGLSSFQGCRCVAEMLSWIQGCLDLYMTSKKRGLRLQWWSFSQSQDQSRETSLSDIHSRVYTHTNSL